MIRKYEEDNYFSVMSVKIGESEINIDGEAVALLNAPEIVNDRTMLPVRDVAEALECDVEWIDETETAVFTRPLQTKRIYNKRNAQ